MVRLYLSVCNNCIRLSFPLSTPLRPAQEKAEGEPKVKKGKTLLDDDEDEDNKEGLDESPEEVWENSFISVSWWGNSMCTVLFLIK